LIVRRVRETVNTLGPHLAAIKRRMKFNAVQLHGDDIDAHSLHETVAVLLRLGGAIPASIPLQIYVTKSIS
jgi:hypothetical protein